MNETNCGREMGEIQATIKHHEGRIASVETLIRESIEQGRESNRLVHKRIDEQERKRAKEVLEQEEKHQEAIRQIAKEMSFVKGVGFILQAVWAGAVALAFAFFRKDS